MNQQAATAPALHLRGVPSGEFPFWAKDLEWHFDSFADRSGGRWTADDYRGMVTDQKAQCWVVTAGGNEEIVCCTLTQIKDDRAKTCEMIACAGEDAKSWVDLMEGIEFWAKASGCTKMRLVCRPGWEKLVTGYTKTHVLLDKEL